MVHDPPATIEPPVRETLPELIVTVPPLQFPVAVPLAERPVGSVSLKFTPVKAVPAFGFVMVKLSVVVPFKGMVAAPNDLPMDGGATTVRVAGVLELPVRASLLDTPDAVFVNAPGTVLVTVNVTVQLAPAGIVMPEKLRFVAPALKAAGVVPVQLPPTVPPAALMLTSVSVNAAPVRLMPELGAVSVSVTTEVPPEGMALGLNALPMVGTMSNDSMN